MTKLSSSESLQDQLIKSTKLILNLETEIQQLNDENLVVRGFLDGLIYLIKEITNILEIELDDPLIPIGKHNEIIDKLKSLTASKES